MRDQTKSRSRSKKFLNWAAVKGLGTVASHLLISGSGLAVVGTIIAWVAAVNLSSATRNLITQATTFLSGNAPPLVYLAAITVGIGLSYRYPKTIMFFASLVLATFYLTPLASTSTIVEPDRPIVASYIPILTWASLAFFVLAGVFLG